MNSLGSKGVILLCEYLKQSKSLISLDLGSNDIKSDGAAALFQTIAKHESITELTLQNHDRLHRNRINTKACASLRDMLASNQILTFLNIADNRIGNGGLSIAAPALVKSNLLVLDLSNNDLVG